MSNVEITPDDYRTAARVLRDSKRMYEVCGNYQGEADFCDAEAAHIERERADEQRIDELAEAFADGLYGADKTFHLWRHLNERNQDSYRAGIRAVLAKLDEQRDAEPRQWDSLWDVPADVDQVRARRRRAHRSPDAAHGWCWDDDSSISLPHFVKYAPYTEVRD